MKEIILITDYKNNFGSKWNAFPYRSGLDKNYLIQLFNERNIHVTKKNFSEINFNDLTWQNKWVLYNSSEDYGLFYKSYVEDIILGLQLSGANLLPRYELLRAHENKVFMEVLRQVRIPLSHQTILSQSFGTKEEALSIIDSGKIIFPCILKLAYGAMSKGVYLIKDQKELIRYIERFGKTMNKKRWLHELVRAYKHKGYIKESRFQKKFILQPFIEGLSHDWKVLIYGNKVFTLKREVRKDDFRASGSGRNYKTGSDSDFPVQFLDFVYEFYTSLDTPNISIDFALNDEKPYIFEFQSIGFGTSTQFKSKDFYQKSENGWELMENIFDQETIYVESIVNYIERKS
jgi:glutathione synthase/RimK-type ligase-like ATP-grasp enzyme